MVLCRIPNVYTGYKLLRVLMKQDLHYLFYVTQAPPSNGDTIKYNGLHNSLSKTIRHRQIQAETLMSVE